MFSIWNTNKLFVYYYMEKEYLTEKKLGEYLNIIFPNYKFIHNRSVPNSNCRYRPDYRNDELKLIVEFDGYTHYTSSKTVYVDQVKDEIYKDMGYNIVRIPYFIQMSSKVIKYLFNVNVKIEQSYPHGFIDEKVILPADYCEMGIRRFEGDLEYFKFISYDILESLTNKIENEFDYKACRVIPFSIKDLFVGFCTNIPIS